MAIRTRSMLLAISIAVLGAGLLAVAARAHPPWNPYDQTRFAPITRFGPMIGIEVVAESDPQDPTKSLTSPLKAVAAPGLPNHLFVVDQPGKLWVVNLRTGVRTLFLDATSFIVTLGVCGPDSFDERGLLGLAFHPNYDGRKPGPGSGLFYTYTSERRDRGAATIPTPGTTEVNADHHNVVAEWRAVNPADPTAGTVVASRRELMRVNWPQFNHDGGDLAFGPDGMLYISMGDGGGADDADGQPFIIAPPHKALPTTPDRPCGSQSEPMFGHQVDGNGQRLNTPLGKIHRIDVNPPFTAGKAYRVPSNNPFVGRFGAVPEIWAYGFRNPYRFSFDSKTGDLYVGDVGQNDLEEVDIVKKGGNFGWNCKEGTMFFHINGSVPDDGVASPTPEGRTANRPLLDCNPGRNNFRDPIAQHDTHHEGHSVIGGFVYHGKGIPGLRGNYIYGDFSLLFKFPSGPHDYGRLFTFNPSGGSGLRQISELLILPGGAVSLAVLGIGQDAQGEIYVTGNVFGVPFGTAGKVLRLVPAPEADADDRDRDDRDRDGRDRDGRDRDDRDRDDD